MLGKQGVAMSREKYKQTICFSPVAFFLSDLRASRLRPVWGYLRGGFKTLYTPGVEHFVVIVSHRLLLQKVPSWVFGGYGSTTCFLSVDSEADSGHF